MLWFLTAVFAVCTVLAGWSMAAGNPTAVSGLIGAGAMTLVMGSLALIDQGA